MDDNFEQLSATAGARVFDWSTELRRFGLGRGPARVAAAALGWVATAGRPPKTCNATATATATATADPDVARVTAALAPLGCDFAAALAPEVVRRLAGGRAAVAWAALRVLQTCPAARRDRDAVRARLGAAHPLAAWLASGAGIAAVPAVAAAAWARAAGVPPADMLAARDLTPALAALADFAWGGDERASSAEWVARLRGLVDRDELAADDALALVFASRIARGASSDPPTRAHLVAVIARCRADGPHAI